MSKTLGKVLPAVTADAVDLSLKTCIKIAWDKRTHTCRMDTCSRGKAKCQQSNEVYVKHWTVTTCPGMNY